MSMQELDEILKQVSVERYSVKKSPECCYHIM